MKVKALRGVCVGVGQNLKAGDTADLSPGTASFLVSIRAVEVLADSPAPSPPKAPPPATKPKPAETSADKPASAGKKET